MLPRAGPGPRRPAAVLTPEPFPGPTANRPGLAWTVRALDRPDRVPGGNHDDRRPHQQRPRPRRAAHVGPHRRRDPRGRPARAHARDGGRHPGRAPGVEGRVLPRPAPHPGAAPGLRPGVRRSGARPSHVAAGVPRLPRDPPARQPGGRRRRRQQDRRARRSRAAGTPTSPSCPSRRWPRSCAASWCRPTGATRSGPTWSRPTSSSRRRCRSSSTASTPCTTTTCRSCGARCRASWPSSSRRGPSARSTPSCGCTRRPARRACSSRPTSPATSSSSPARRAVTCSRCCSSSS